MQQFHVLPVTSARLRMRICEWTVRTRDLVLFALMACLMWAASLTLFGAGDEADPSSYFALRHQVAGVCVLILLLANAGRLQVLTRWPRNSLIMVFWICLTVACVVSSFYQLDEFAIIATLWSLVGVPCIFYALLPASHGNLMQLAIYAYLVSHLPYLIASLLYHPIVVPYRGVFPSPNQFGGITAAMAACMLAILHSSIKRKASVMRITTTLALIAGLSTLTLLSASRTSLVALLASYVLVLGALLYDRTTRSNLVVSAMLVSLLIPLVRLDGKSLGVSIYEKHMARTSILIGRGDIWSTALADTSLLGHGRHYFSSTVGLGAHNSVVDVLGRHGIVAAFALLGLAVTSVLGALSYAIKRLPYDPYALAPLVLIATFWIMSMAEGMFGSIGKGVTLLTFASIGVVMHSQGGRSPRVNICPSARWHRTIST